MKNVNTLIKSAFLAVSLITSGYSAVFSVGNLLYETKTESFLANSMRTTNSFKTNILNNIGSPTFAFTFSGVNYSYVGGLATTSNGLSDIAVGLFGNTTYDVDASYLFKSSNDKNYFGVSDSSMGNFTPSGPINTSAVSIFSQYGSTTPAQTWNISSNTGLLEDVNFWHYDNNGQYKGTKFSDNLNHFAVYTGLDISTNTLNYVIGVNDRGTSAVDYNDGVFLLEFRTNTVSIDNTPVPEPSTYAACGALGLIALAGFKRKRK